MLTNIVISFVPLTGFKWISPRLSFTWLPHLFGVEPLPTSPDIDANVLGQNTLGHRTMWDSGSTGHYWIATTQLNGWRRSLDT